MPRTLPWLAQKTSKPQAKPPSSSAPASKPKRGRAATPTCDLVDSDLNTLGTVTPRRQNKRRLDRSPSTSPPPAPPPVEYMREGYDADDVWMMVEDEFYSTAQSFTQHIHFAEYVRLKKLAKARGQGSIAEIARPTDGRTPQSSILQLQAEANANSKLAKKGMKTLVEDGANDEADEDDYMDDPQLAGLMMGSRRGASHDLTMVAKSRANTRAAAGFSKSPQKQREKAIYVRKEQREFSAKQSNEDNSKRSWRLDSREGYNSDDNGVDKIHTAKAKRALSGNSATEQPASGFFKRFANGSPERKLSHKPPTPHTSSEILGINNGNKGINDDADITSITSGARSHTTSDFLAKRRAAKAAKEKQEQEAAEGKGKSAVEVPTFLI
ncbi:hypothetical protein BAUCODRAFT_152089 [Baudoinia panamericana UAMH 10762]|uniref:Uncharacterized protein n=1 Tax=Baudoinia panamericana (strain UAMH 10762) TaxID=717646 RepID=M2MZD4_BAUPA|nr:uncharacterized protein BAUCODRAFT_152089 [Baudoinia panamericana UAMH 10762]EMC91695.1 hypothetical protein BAUCODRAFT_152089 [Baudoinia panamericana UAMH 10762]